MGKASRVKVELQDAKDLLELIQVLKDVADMKYHSLSADKDSFARFGESFREFFRLTQVSELRHPLVFNENPKTIVVALTTEEGFVGDLNSKIVANALDVYRSSEEGSIVICIGRRGLGRFEQAKIKPEKIIENISETGLYESAVQLKDYLVEKIMSGEFGKVIVAHPVAKDFTTIRHRKLALLPCSEVFKQQAQTVEQFKKVIEESNPVNIIGYMAGIWLVSKFYEMLFELAIAAAAAQSQQLDSSLGKMKKETATVKLKYRKAKNSDIDNSLREVFSARLVAKK